MTTFLAAVSWDSVTSTPFWSRRAKSGARWPTARGCRVVRGMCPSCQCGRGPESRNCSPTAWASSGCRAGALPLHRCLGCHGLCARHSWDALKVPAGCSPAVTAASSMSLASTSSREALGVREHDEAPVVQDPDHVDECVPEVAVTVAEPQEHGVRPARVVLVLHLGTAQVLDGEAELVVDVAVVAELLDHLVAGEPEPLDGRGAVRTWVDRRGGGRVHGVSSLSGFGGTRRVLGPVHQPGGVGCKRDCLWSRPSAGETSTLGHLREEGLGIVEVEMSHHRGDRARCRDDVRAGHAEALLEPALPHRDRLDAGVRHRDRPASEPPGPQQDAPVGVRPGVAPPGERVERLRAGGGCRATRAAPRRRGRRRSRPLTAPVARARATVAGRPRGCRRAAASSPARLSPSLLPDEPTPATLTRSRHQPNRRHHRGWMISRAWMRCSGIVMVRRSVRPSVTRTPEPTSASRKLPCVSISLPRLTATTNTAGSMAGTPARASGPTLMTPAVISATNSTAPRKMVEPCRIVATKSRPLGTSTTGIAGTTARVTGTASDVGLAEVVGSEVARTSSDWPARSSRCSRSASARPRRR